MKKIFMILLSAFLIAGAVYESLGNEVSMKISEYEEGILEAASVQLPYKSGIKVDSEIIDPLVRTALAEAAKYENAEETKYKTPEKNVYVNLKGAYKKINLILGTDLADYAGLIDNIIINANGVYLHVKPTELNIRKSNTDSVQIEVVDKNNVVAKYNGTAGIRFLKLILMVLFAAAAVYIFVFMLKLKGMSLKEGANKKLFYITGSCFFVLSATLFAVVLFADFSSAADRKPVKFRNGKTAYFDVQISGSSQDLRGVYMGIPPYEDGLNPDLASVFRQSADSVKGDTALGGNYQQSMNIIKFPLEESGSYYIRNNDVSFSDVNQSDEGLYEAVSILAAKNILSGKSDDVFGTEDTVTRAETVTMLCKMLNIGFDGNGEDFADISNSDWFYTYAMGAKENGVLSGYDDNTFRAQNTITRQEFAALMGQIMQNRMGYVLPEDNSALSAYSDGGSIADWAKPYVSLMEREGVGIWQEAFLPYQPITRGEAAMLLYRVYCLYD